MLMIKSGNYWKEFISLGMIRPGNYWKEFISLGMINLVASHLLTYSMEQSPP
jgi:hypothetical protein